MSRKATAYITDSGVLCHSKGDADAQEFKEALDKQVDLDLDGLDRLAGWITANYKITLRD